MPVAVNIEVMLPNIIEEAGRRFTTCQLLVTSTASLPRAPYTGTVRITGKETSATGSHPCRLLKHFSVQFSQETPVGLIYQLRVDISDESFTPSYPIKTPQSKYLDQNKYLDESAEIICKRVAGLFGRYCEQYKPPSVIIK